MGKFSLPAKATDIAHILDDEPDVARFYAELVPANVSSATEFWGRYFYRLEALSKPNAPLFDHEDEDESADWDKDDEASAGVDEPTPEALREDNGRLRGVVKSLVAKIAGLERDLQTRDDELRELKRIARKTGESSSLEGVSTSSSAREIGNEEATRSELSEVASAAKNTDSATTDALSAARNEPTSAVKDGAASAIKESASPSRQTRTPSKSSSNARPTVSAKKSASAAKSESASPARPVTSSTKKALAGSPETELSNPAEGEDALRNRGKRANATPTTPLADVDDEEEAGEWS